MYDEVIRATSAQLPQFNDYLLKDFRNEQLQMAPDFMETIFREAVKLFRGEIEYVGYRALSPEERTNYELNNKITGGYVNIKKNEWVLYEYRFKYENEQYELFLYLPYFHHRFIVINNTQYSIQLAISEKVFTKINDGITAKVVRSPINFWRNRIYTMVSASSKKSYFESLVTVKVHNKGKKHSKKQVTPTVVHYLLCKYGLNMTLDIFSIKKEDCFVVDKINEKDTDDYEYFGCRKTPKTKPQIYLKVKKELLDSEHTKQSRVIACILYLLNNFKKHTIEDLYDPSCTIYKIMLGKLIHGTNIVDAMALNYMNNHMASLDSYLDPITQGRLKHMGIFVNNIYDLFVYVFWEIDHMLIHNAHSDLYDKRIDILDTLLVSTIVKSIYYSFYAAESRSKVNSKLVARLLKINSRKIISIYESKIVRMNPSRYNDNWLLSVGSKKVRLHKIKSTDVNLLSAPEHRFHPSFGYVESLIAFSQSNPGSSGTINPFLPIDSNGFIVKEAYAAELDEISKYLPYQTPQEEGDK